MADIKRNGNALSQQLQRCIFYDNLTQKYFFYVGNWELEAVIQLSLCAFSLTRTLTAKN